MIPPERFSQPFELVVTAGDQDQVAFSAANSQANSSPMPEEAPVISAVSFGIGSWTLGVVARAHLLSPPPERRQGAGAAETGGSLLWCSYADSPCRRNGRARLPQIHIGGVSSVGVSLSGGIKRR